MTLHDVPPEAPTVDAEAAAARAGDDDTMFVDVRDPEAYRHGHAFNALNVPANEVEERLADAPQDHFLLVYGDDDADTRARLVVAHLEEAGARVGLVAGGWEALLGAGVETVASEDPKGGDTASRGYMSPPSGSRQDR